MDTNETIERWASTACRPGLPKLSDAELTRELATFAGWKVQNGAVSKTFRFAGYLETVAFANAVAWVAQREDHHPDMTVGYDRCGVAFVTHSAGGVTANDLACAAKVERLMAKQKT